MALGCGLFFGMCALFVELHALAVATMFMTQHTARVCFPCPTVIPMQYPHLSSTVQFFAGYSALH
jgi:hypothetical protein